MGVWKYFLAGKPFIGGDSPSIADLMWICTLEQTAAAGADHRTCNDYIERVRQSIVSYDDVTEEWRNVPESLKAMKMLETYRVLIQISCTDILFYICLHCILESIIR